MTSAGPVPTDLRGSVKQTKISTVLPAHVLVVEDDAIIGLTISILLGFTLAIIFSMGALSWIACAIRKSSAPERYSMKLSTMIYNSGNWGIPLMALAFTELGGVVQVFVLATMNVTSFTLGVFLANAGSAERKGWIVPVLKQPSPWALVVALLFRSFGNPLEEVVFVWTPLTYLADALVAFALITLGVQLSQTRPPAPRGNLAIALAIRLLGGPAVGILLTWALGFRGEIAAILILGTAAPTAVNTALLAHEFRGDVRFASAAVFYSTLLASVVVTALLAALRAGWIPWAVAG